MQVFWYSIVYLMALFGLLLIDHYLPGSTPSGYMQMQPITAASAQL